MLGALSPLLQGVVLNYTQGKPFNLLKIQRFFFCVKASRSARIYN